MVWIMTMARGTTNTNARGSSEDRRRRKAALLHRDGDGKKAPCHECGIMVTAETMICDRQKPGVRGGTYRLDNVLVHCRSCSEAQGRRMSTETRRWKAWRLAGLHRSRLAPTGFRHTDRRWHIYLGNHYVGFVRRGRYGWESYRYDLAFHVVTETADNYTQGLYLLLCQYTGKEAA